MEQKIWRHFLEILIFRRDLIDIIKPFLENLKNSQTNEQFSIQDPKFLPYLKSLRAYQLELLHKYDIINYDIYSTLRSKKANSSKSSTPKKENSSQSLALKKPSVQKLVKKLIKDDNFRELQHITLEKDINKFKIISSSFEMVKTESIPILIYCIIQNAINCFKYLLINGIDDPRKTMKSRKPIPHPHPRNVKWKDLHIYEWDCMATTIFYGRVEIMKILEENGIEKGEKLNHIEAAFLSFRFSIAKDIIEQIKEKDEKDETMIQNLLNKGLVGSAKSNFIKGGEYIIKQISIKNNFNIFHIVALYNSVEIGTILLSKGVNINGKDITYQITNIFV